MNQIGKSPEVPLIVNFVLDSKFKEQKELNPPKVATVGSVCADLCADVDEGFPLLIHPGSMMKVPTGLYIALPDGWEAQIRPRSGLAAKNQITIQNTPGTIDTDYRGEIIVLLRNEGSSDFKINRGDRIAQIAIREVPYVEFRQVDSLDETKRGSGGLGHTGVQ